MQPIKIQSNYFRGLNAMLVWRFALLNVVRGASTRASVGKIKRKTYTRMYPTILVLSDGSTVNIRHEDAKQILKVFIFNLITMDTIDPQCFSRFSTLVTNGSLEQFDLGLELVNR